MFIQNDNSPAIQHSNRVVKGVWRLTLVESSRKRPQKIRRETETESLDRRGLIYLCHFLMVASSFSGGCRVFVCKSVATLPSSGSSSVVRMEPWRLVHVNSVNLLNQIYYKDLSSATCTRLKSLCSQAALFNLNSLCLSKNIWLI